MGRAQRQHTGLLRTIIIVCITVRGDIETRSIVNYHYHFHSFPRISRSLGIPSLHTVSSILDSFMLLSGNIATFTK